jgi:uncharacterized glyoxalase superfamily protein PhnB
MARAVAFYRRLGLDFPAGAENAEHAETTLSGGLRLMLDTVELVRGFVPDWSDPRGSARISLAFEFPTPPDVDAAFRSLVAAGAEPHREPWDAFWGQRYAMLRDPDGNRVNLFAPSRAD